MEFYRARFDAPWRHGDEPHDRKCGHALSGTRLPDYAQRAARAHVEVDAANLGVNPALTICAQAERAMAFWPNNGNPDPRPLLGSPYEQIDPIPPIQPTVPPSAPGALRLPVEEDAHDH